MVNAVIKGNDQTFISRKAIVSVFNNKFFKDLFPADHTFAAIFYKEHKVVFRHRHKKRPGLGKERGAVPVRNIVRQTLFRKRVGKQPHHAKVQDEQTEHRG